MIRIGNFFFKYRNLVFPIFALSIFLIPSPLLFSPDTWGESYYLIPMTSGLIIAFTGQLIRAFTIALKYIVRGGKNKKVYAEDLVTDGMFHHCRNPLYVGNILMLLGVGILSNSLFFVLFTLPLFCFIYQAIVLAEENYLRNKFGNTFDAYAKNVNRWIPNLIGIRTTVSGMEFNWRRYVVNEYNTIYLLLVAIGIMLITNHPDLKSLGGDQKIRVSIIVFCILSLIYLYVRYLNKSKKLTSTVSSKN